MPVHKVEQISAAVETAVGTTLKNVFRSRAYSVQESDLDCYVITNEGERSVSEAFTTQDWKLEIGIVAVAQSNATDLETVLNAMRYDLHMAMVADTTLGGLCADIIESRVDAVSIQDGATQPIGTLRTIWTILYRRDRSDPSI